MEAAALDQPGVLSRAEDLLSSGKVLAAGQPEYPLRWETKLGASAPPVFWKLGEMPAPPFVVIVGSRNPLPGAWKFASALAVLVVEKGFSVASGGAYGIDTVAARASTAACKDKAPPLVEILPRGLASLGKAKHCILSAAPPSEPFSTPLAMERNTLLYALAETAVVCQPRLREGGSWHGACGALRRKLTRVCVLDDDSAAAKALVALGAVGVRSPEEVFVTRESQAELLLAE